jgi:hypothetical protein
MKLIFAIIFLFVFSHCSTCNCGKGKNSQSSDAGYENLQKISKEKYGDTFVMNANESKDLYLVTDFMKSATELSIKFFVYNIKSGKIVLEDFISSGSVKWADKYLLDVQIHPGTIQKNNPKTDIGYFYNFETNQKITK